MLVTLKEILEIAEERKIAVGSFNTPNLESLMAVIGGAKELGVPVIIQFAQCHEPWIPLSVIGPIMVEHAKRAEVPVCVHLDHGETLEYLQQALDMGFTGIMYDGSVLPYEENRENTKAATAMAAKTGAGVEAELGSMGKRESGAGDGTGRDEDIHGFRAGEAVRGGDGDRCPGLFLWNHSRDLSDEAEAGLRRGSECEEAYG